MPIVIYKPRNTYPPQGEGTRVGFDRLILKAGVNHLSDEVFATLKRHPDFASYVERKALVVQESTTKVDPVPLTEIPKNLTGYNVEEAEEIIDETHDIDVLKAWLQGESRKTTRNDINQRIKQLEGGEA